MENLIDNVTRSVGGHTGEALAAAGAGTGTNAEESTSTGNGNRAAATQVNDAPQRDNEEVPERPIKRRKADKHVCYARKRTPTEAFDEEVQNSNPAGVQNTVTGEGIDDASTTEEIDVENADQDVEDEEVVACPTRSSHGKEQPEASNAVGPPGIASATIDEGVIQEDAATDRQVSKTPSPNEAGQEKNNAPMTEKSSDNASDLTGEKVGAGKMVEEERELATFSNCSPMNDTKDAIAAGTTSDKDLADEKVASLQLETIIACTPKSSNAKRLLELPKPVLGEGLEFEETIGELESITGDLLDKVKTPKKEKVGSNSNGDSCLQNTPLSSKKKKKQVRLQKLDDTLTEFREGVNHDVLQAMRSAVGQGLNAEASRQKYKKAVLSPDEAVLPDENRQLIEEVQHLKDEIANRDQQIFLLSGLKGDKQATLETFRESENRKNQLVAANKEVTYQLELANEGLARHSRLTMEAEACKILTQILAPMLWDYMQLQDSIGGKPAKTLRALVRRPTYNRLGAGFCRPGEEVRSTDHLKDDHPAKRMTNKMKRLLPMIEDIDYDLWRRSDKRNKQNHLVKESEIPDLVKRMKDELEENIGIAGVDDRMYNGLREILDNAYARLQGELIEKAREQAAGAVWD